VEELSITELEERFMLKFEDISEKWGLGRPLGRVLGILILSPKPLTQHEIVLSTNYSPSLVSTALSMLESLGMVSIVGRRGRRKLYKAAVTFIDAFKSFINRFIDNDLNPVIELLSSNIDKIQDENKRAHVKNILDEYMKLKALMKIFSGMIDNYRKLSYKSIESLIT